MIIKQNYTSVAGKTEKTTVNSLKTVLVNHKKCHFVFYYNSGISCSIFIIFAPVETGRNTLQYTYLIA